MANWVTLQNGVHIDLDDPNNPITGSGSFEDLGNSGGGSKGGAPKSSSDIRAKIRELDDKRDELGEQKAALTVKARGQHSAENDKLNDDLNRQTEKINEQINKLTEELHKAEKNESSTPKAGTKAAAMQSLKTSMNKWIMDENDCQAMVDAISTDQTMRKQVLDAIDKSAERSRSFANDKSMFPTKELRDRYIKMVDGDAFAQKEAIKTQTWGKILHRDSAVADDLIDIVRETFGLKRPKKK